MATGDLNDLRSRIKATLPRWFADSSPILDAVLSGAAQALSFVYSLYLYAQMQTRIKTATDGWLDLIAGDFFGTRILRRANQSDASFRAIIIANLFRERATRTALIQVLTDLTGRAPVLIEPQQPGDTGAYGGTDAITISGTPQVFRNDWQGIQLLYTTPRTNVALQSESFASAAWQKIATTVASNTDPAPDGVGMMDTLTGTAATTSYVQQAINGLTAGTTYTASVFLKAGTSPASLLRLYDINVATFLAGVVVNWVGGAPLLSSPAGWAVAPTVSPTSFPGVYMVAGGVALGALTGAAVLIYPSLANAAESVKAWGVNLKPGGTLTGYISTTTAPVTVTDYSIDSAGRVIFAPAPSAGAVLSWSGTYLNARTSQTVTVSGKTFANGDGFSTAFSVAPKYGGYPCGYGVAGFYGSKLLPSQMFLIAYRPASAGIPNIAGYGNPQGAYRTPPVSMYASLSMIQGQVTDADIYAAIDSVKPVGTVIWTTIKS